MPVATFKLYTFNGALIEDQPSLQIHEQTHTWNILILFKIQFQIPIMTVCLGLGNPILCLNTWRSMRAGIQLRARHEGMVLKSFYIQ